MNRYPAVVSAYTDKAKVCEVHIPGLTDGAGAGLTAEFEYPLGDRDQDTAIRIKVGDPVWVAFLAGDQRYPIVTGFRARLEPGMGVVRHWEYDNFNLTADDTVVIQAGKSIKLQVGGSTIELTPDTIAQIASANSIKGPVEQTGGDFTSDGISAQKHTHMEQGDGAPTGEPM